MAKVAFLGLGVMGYPMARHLKAKGHEVTVYNRTAAKADKWVSENGGRAARAPREAAEDQEIVFACVGNDDDLRQVTLGPDGAFAGMRSGSVFVDHTTASAEVARELDKAAIEKGLGFVDAPVLRMGNSPGMTLPSVVTPLYGSAKAFSAAGIHRAACWPLFAMRLPDRMGRSARPNP